jgi:hypothetical protein
MEVERKTVAQIHAGRNAQSAEKQACGDSRVRPQMTSPGLPFACCQSMCGRPEFARDINTIARPGTASRERFARQHFAATHYIRDHVIKASQIAAR